MSGRGWRQIYGATQEVKNCKEEQNPYLNIICIVLKGIKKEETLLHRGKFQGGESDAA